MPQFKVENKNMAFMRGSYMSSSLIMREGGMVIQFPGLKPQALCLKNSVNRV